MTNPFELANLIVQDAYRQAHSLHPIKYSHDGIRVYYTDITGRKELFATAETSEGAYVISDRLNNFNQMLTERNYWQSFAMRKDEE